jgi:alginate O-acetyltransferase complex protein AlgJ
MLAGEQWAKQSAKASMLHFVKGEPETRVIKGDLIPEAKRDAWDAEEVVVRKAGVKQGNAIRSVLPDDESSPVILLGDSHTLIFHEGGDMLMSGAGVPDHLQAALGFKVYLAASRGSSSQAQRQIYKGADFWKGKKALVWVSSVREFTRERKWLKLPRLPK